MVDDDLRNNNSHWRTADDSWLRNNWADMSPSACAKALGRTESAVTQRAYVLGISGFGNAFRQKPISQIANQTALTLEKAPIASKKIRRKWTKLDEKFFQENYGKIPTDVLAEKLGTTKISLHSKASKMRKKAGGLKSIMSRDAHFWTKEETDLLVEFHAKEPLSEIAKMLGLSYMQVATKVTDLRRIGRITTASKAKSISVGKNYSKNKKDDFIAKSEKSIRPPLKKKEGASIDFDSGMEIPPGYAYVPVPTGLVPTPRKKGVFSRIWVWLFGEKA